MARVDESKVRRLREEVPQSTGVEGLPDDYQKHFALHSEGGVCLYCGNSHTFTWGLAHGSGHCIECGWPARLYHFPKDAEGKEMDRVVILLQYHPKEIILSGERGEEDTNG